MSFPSVVSLSVFIAAIHKSVGRNETHNNPVNWKSNKQQLKQVLDLLNENET